MKNTDNRSHNLTEADRSKGGKHSHNAQPRQSQKKDSNKSSRSNQSNTKKSS